MAANKAVHSLLKCYDRIRCENKKATDLTKQAFPINSRVAWLHGLSEISATVIEHNPYFDRLKVRGVTGKEYWVDARKLAQHMGRP